MGAGCSDIQYSELKDKAANILHVGGALADPDHPADKDEKKMKPEDLEKKKKQLAEEAVTRRHASISYTGYKGDRVDDRKHGEGSFTYENGDTYVGEWQKDKAQGKGTYTTPHTIYTGEWHEDLKNGAGEEKYFDDEGGQCEYKGDFLQGHRHGKGLLTWQDGTTYEGDFLNNNIQGIGTFKFKNGQKYTGNVSDNCIDGPGRYEWPDGTAYEGQYKLGMKHGEGHFNLKSGYVMKCMWKDGKPTGPVAFKAKEIVPPYLDWYEGVMISWATRSEDGTPRPGEKHVTSAAHLFDGHRSARMAIQRTASGASGGSGGSR